VTTLAHWPTFFPISTLRINPVSNRFKMIRIYTCSIFAKMINLGSFWQISFVEQIRQYMRSNTFPFVANTTVSIAFSSSPDPTA